MLLVDRVATVRPTDRALRLVRSVAAALICVAAAAVGHVVAGGVLLPLAAAAVFAGATAVTWLLSTRRITTGQMAGLLLLCQVLVHLASPTHDMSMGPAMLAGHALATSVSALVMARGERFVWLLADHLALRVLPQPLSPVALPVGPEAVPSSAPRSLRDVRLTHSRVLRGPPVGV